MKTKKPEWKSLKPDSDDQEIYKLSDEQKKAINEARQQIKNGQTLTDDQANAEADEWLKN